MQAIGRVDYQMSQNHSLFGRYMATTYFFNPPFAESGNILSTTIGGRDNLAQSVALGDTMVLSNTVVNNVRFAFNRTAIHRTHVDFFGPNDIGVNSFSYLDDYMLLTVTGGFNLGGGTENDAIFHDQHLHVRRRPDDDPRRPPVGIRRAGTRSGIRCRRRTSGRRAPTPSTAASRASAWSTS